jgi:WD40 repeat protein
MNVNVRLLSRAVVGLMCSLLAAGCGFGSKPSTAASAKGTAGSTFTVKVNNPGSTGGTVVSGTLAPDGVTFTADGKISCGGGSTQCSADYPWGTAGLALQATTTQYFDGWFGDCSGTSFCQLSGTADKYVVAVFSATPESHPNFTDPTVHGPAYDAFATNPTTAVLKCTNCHGANLQGQGLAPSCSSCHAWPLPTGGETTGTFTATGSMAFGRSGHTATLLSSGQVLVAGGDISFQGSAEIYNPNTGTFAATGAMTTGRQFATATLLPNGLVLVTGGYGCAAAGCYLASAELYNPATGTFALTGNMTTSRVAHTATLLPNGLVLVAGGIGSEGLWASAELYDPATGSFTPTGSMTVVRYGHTATLLPNGRVLIVGGGGGSAQASAEVFDPATGAFTATGSMAWAREGATATLLPNGLVLVAAGWLFANDSYVIGASAELYDPGKGTFTATGSMQVARSNPAATILSNGFVLIAGGVSPEGFYLSSAEVYNPTTGTFAGTGIMTTGREGETATLLPSGLVLLTGGIMSDSSRWASAELYTPAGAGAGASYQIGGTVSGLTGSGLVLAMAGEPSLNVGAGATKFAFANPVAAGSSYAVSIVAQPTDQTCFVTSGSGVLGAANVDSISVNCRSVPAGMHRVFVTSQLFDGNLGGVAGADAKCQAAAQAAGISGTFKAWISTVADGGPAARFTRATTPYTLLDGTIIADNWTALTSGYLRAPIYLTELGGVPPQGTGASHYGQIWYGWHIPLVFSNTTYDGNVSDPNGDCGGWASTQQGYPGYGRADDTGGWWSAYVTGQSCTETAPLYCFEQSGGPVTGTSQLVGSLPSARYGHSATLLPNGKVLVAGGEGETSPQYSDAYLYDPGSRTFAPTGSMTSGRFFHTATLLPNGKVLVAGGDGGNTAELYDPATGQFTPTGNTNASRFTHTATLLPNGRVLLLGGSNGAIDSTAELYDPATGTFASTGSLGTGRYLHTATLLPNGKVLVAGGMAPAGSSDSSLSSVELYDPAAGSFAPGGSMNEMRYGHAAALLSNGTVLIANGYNNTTGLLSSAELYDPATGAFAWTGSSITAHDGATATMLPGGKVLLAYGDGDPSNELYDPATRMFSLTASQGVDRYDATATLLPDGSVLIVGGGAYLQIPGYVPYLATAELYIP